MPIIGSSKKAKLLYIQDYLFRHSNPSHPVTASQIVDYLDDNGIEAEKKSVMTDIAILQDFGKDIVIKRGSGGGIYYNSRDFSLPEIKMLVDCVQVSKFITEKQSETLIKKLEGLTDKYDTHELSRQVVSHNRVKTEQTNVFENIGSVSTAINDDKIITFKYCIYDKQKKLTPKNGGKDYVISPFCLVWDSECYYMIGYDKETDKMKNYRVDKMKDVSVTDVTRQGKEYYNDVDISSYNKRVFNMYHGEEKRVTLRFANNLMGVVIDKFGKEVWPSYEEDHFTIDVDIAVSNQFFSWVFGLGDGCEIVSPEETRDEYKEMCKKVLGKHSD